jgi:DNA-binding response OmpR family regulator
MRESILLVDDDADVSDLVSRYLSNEGVIVHTASTAEAARRHFAATPVDLVLLDVRLPDGDGFDLLRDLRIDTPVPVIMVTSQTASVDRVLGLDLGADDYLVKPFALRELRARIRAVLRRTREDEDTNIPASDEALTFAGLTLDLSHRRLLDGAGREIGLTSGEFDLLRVFAERPRRALSRDHLMDLARSRNWRPLDRSIDMLVSRLRRKIAANASDAELIVTTRNVGYTFIAEVKRTSSISSAPRQRHRWRIK